MSRADKIWMSAAMAATTLVLSLGMFEPWARSNKPQEKAATWNSGRVTAAYVASQLKEIDKAHSTLLISYDLENLTDSDYRLSEGPGVLLLSRLKSDGSLSQEQALKLSYPVFLPSQQHARLAVAFTQPFAWPSREDPAYLEKLREFVKRSLGGVSEFVVFDQATHTQLPLPGGWTELPSLSSAGL